jgi:hypothetical protein
MNLLATGTALGLVVFVFQDGHGEDLLGFSSPGFIQAFLPLCMFVLLFGLSMALRDLPDTPNAGDVARDSRQSTVRSIGSRAYGATDLSYRGDHGGGVRQ